MKTDFQEIRWLHASFCVPATWEITAYSIGEREGRLEFSSRNGFQGLFSWEPCKIEPSRQSLLAAFPERIGKVKGEDVLQTSEEGLFVLGWRATDQPCQALGYLKTAQKKIRWIFPGAAPAVLEKVVRPILASASENLGPVRRYTVFGLDFQLPDTYKPESIQIQPADAELVFESRKKARISLHRWGLPEVLLQGGALEMFYATFLRTRGAILRRIKSFPASAGHLEMVEAGYDQTGEHKLDRYMGRIWKNGEGRLWYDREEKRLYSIEQIGPPGVPLLPLESVLMGNRHET